MTYPIKKLPHTINNYDLYPIIETVNQIIDHIQPIEAPTEEVKGDWIDKVMNDMEHIKFHIDSRYCDWEQCKKEVRQSIEKHKPMPFDNEYYKQPVEQELIPLLPRDIVAITDEIICLDELGKVDEDRIHKILSKYGVHKQEEITQDTSDGYHTFKELYEHRTLLLARLCDFIPSHKSKKHTDGTMYDGMFIVRAYLNGKQIAYHCDLKYWDNFQCVEQEMCDERDGHTTQDVIKRLSTPTPQATSVIDVEEVVNKIMDTIYNDFGTCESECKGTKSTIKEHLSSLPIVQKKRNKETILNWFDKRDGKYHTQNQHIKELDKILSD